MQILIKKTWHGNLNSWTIEESSAFSIKISVFLVLTLPRLPQGFSEMMSVSIHIRSVYRRPRLLITEQRKSQNFVLIRLDCVKTWVYPDVKTCEVPFLLLYSCIFRVNVDFFHFLFSLFDVTGECYWVLNPGWAENLCVFNKVDEVGTVF